MLKSSAEALQNHKWSMSNILSFYGDEHPWFNVPLENAKSSVKVGIINWWTLSDDQARLDRVLEFVDSNDVCFFLSEEILYRGNDFSRNVDNLIIELNKRNVFYILFSEDRQVPFNTQRVFYRPWFFKEMLHIPSTVNIDLDYRPKKYTFNMLLGSNKPYRTLKYKILSQNEKIYSTYFGHPIYKDESNIIFEEVETLEYLKNQDVKNNKINTMFAISRENTTRPMSQTAPSAIYNNTHFDIISETFIKNSHHFFTEKIGKPLATGRFFCSYSSNGLKDHLMKYGFSFDTYFSKTNYDTIQDNMTRLVAMIDDVEYITNDDLLVQDIYTKTREERKHNIDVFKQHQKSFVPELVDWIYNVVQNGGA